MNPERELIDEYCDRMKIGEHIEISRDMFQEAFRCGWPTIYRTHRQAFLSSRIGAAWGAWRCEVNLMTGDYEVSRHNPGNARVYIDPDREYLWKPE